MSGHAAGSSLEARTSAIGAVFAVAIGWGVAFSVVKEALGEVSPASLVMWRFTIATTVLICVRPWCLLRLRRATWRRGATLGCVLAAGFLFHTWGMQSTPVVASAFITGTVVVFAPLVARIYLGRALTPRGTVAVALSTFGLAAITLGGVSIGSGEILITVAAVLWAVHLVALEVWSRSGDLYAMAVIQVAVVALLAALVQLMAYQRIELPRQISTVEALVGLGAFATGGAFLALTWAQSRIDATTAAVILTLEPVFGAATALALGATISWRVALGAAAVIIAALLVTRPTANPASYTCSRSAGRSPWRTVLALHRPAARRAL